MSTAETRAAFEQHANFFEYSSAADPDVPAIPFATFPASLHAAPDAPFGVTPLDLSASW